MKMKEELSSETTADAKEASSPVETIVNLTVINMEDIIIIGTENITSEGLTLIFNKPTRLKGSKGLKSKEWWLSWDAIGKGMVEGYTDKTLVSDRDKLRKSE